VRNVDQREPTEEGVEKKRSGLHEAAKRK